MTLQALAGPVAGSTYSYSATDLSGRQVHQHRVCACWLSPGACSRRSSKP
jgi:hypothetical protein